MTGQSAIAPATAPVIALEMQGIQKAYGGAPALRDGCLRVEAGSIHGVVGPNGAGKSTLVKIASGQVRRDAGEIRVRGDAVHFQGVPDALAAGVVVMPQELTIVPELSVAENITLGREPSLWGMLSPGSSVRAAEAVLRRMNVDIPSSTPAGELGPASQRVVMLARALHAGAHTVILDEPTAALNATEAEVFLGVVETLREAGVAVVYISHRFGEIERLCDEVTVMRDGRTVDRLTGDRCNQHELVAAIMAEAETGHAPERERGRHEGSPALLAVRDLTGRRLRGVNLSLGRGEILGLCGLPGSGINELMEILGGAQRPAHGSILVDEREVTFGDPADALACGISYLPVERARAGMLDLTIRANLMASSIPRVGRLGVLNAAMESRFVRPVVSELGLERRIEEPLRALSGGNRQKILLSRCMLADARVLILDDPTVGVDVKARQEIHDLLARISSEGRSVVVAVSEPEELVGLADRVLVLSRGQVSAELIGGKITSEALVRAVTTAGAVLNA